MTYNVGGVLLPGRLKVPGLLVILADDGTSVSVSELQKARYQRF